MSVVAAYAYIDGKRVREIRLDDPASLAPRDGEFVSTRLFQSGVRTFPYFQESSDAVMQSGDLVCFDTDAIGVRNYAVDFSRTFLCGDVEATPVQRHLYGIAREQLEHNASLIAAGRARMKSC